MVHTIWSKLHFLLKRYVHVRLPGFHQQINPHAACMFFLFSFHARRSKFTSVSRSSATWNLVGRGRSVRSCAVMNCCAEFATLLTEKAAAPHLMELRRHESSKTDSQARQTMRIQHQWCHLGAQDDKEVPKTH